MYTLISAIAKPRGAGGRWTSVDIGSVGLSTLFATYSRILAVLSNPFLTHQVCLDLIEIRAEHGGKAITFNELLASLGSDSLPTTNRLPVINTRYAKYKDAVRAGYKITPIHPTFAVDAELPPAERTWLRLTKAGVDYANVQRNCLVSVNGYFHYTDSDPHGMYVVDGMRSQTVSRQNQLGLFDLSKLGGFTLHQIKPEMLYKQSTQDRYRDRCFVDLGVDVTNKTVLLVLGGYLHALDTRSYYQVGVSQFCINLQTLPLLDRYYESRKYLDLSALELETTQANPTQISVEDFYSDAVLGRYLTLPQSFFVILDNPEVFVEHKTVHKTKMPGMFISYSKPEYPLVTGVGRLADYWSTYEDGQYSLTCVDSFRDRPVYHTVDASVVNSVSDTRDTQLAVVNAPAFFLKLGSDI